MININWIWLDEEIHLTRDEELSSTIQKPRMSLKIKSIDAFTVKIKLYKTSVIYPCSYVPKHEDDGVPRYDYLDNHEFP